MLFKLIQLANYCLTRRFRSGISSEIWWW